MSEGVRGRGWGSVAALTLVTAFLSVVTPVLLIFVPLALLFVAFPPRRPLLLAVSIAVGWLALSGPAEGTLWYFERGWVLVLGAWFVVLLSLLPEWRFLSAAMASLALTVVTATGLLALRSEGLLQLDAAVTSRLRAGAGQVLTAFARAAGEAGVAEDVTVVVYRVADVQARLYPAMLALASLAALAVAWWAYARLVRGEGNPLGRLREFRFRDELVWLLIVGAGLLVLPVGELAGRAGQNLLTFMAALYALRGLAVLLVIGGGTPGPLGVLLGVLLFIFMVPFVIATTVLVGLSDTWLDLRARRRASSSPGS